RDDLSYAARSFDHPALHNCVVNVSILHAGERRGSRIGRARCGRVIKWILHARYALRAIRVRLGQLGELEVARLPELELRVPRAWTWGVGEEQAPIAVSADIGPRDCVESSAGTTGRRLESRDRFRPRRAVVTVLDVPDRRACLVLVDEDAAHREAAGYARTEVHS